MLLGPTDLFGLREDISCISFLLVGLKKSFEICPSGNQRSVFVFSNWSKIIIKNIWNFNLACDDGVIIGK